jgi:hypothetical protein
MSLRGSYQYEEPVEKQFTNLEPGEYPFVVSEVFAWEQSAKGNDMLPIKLQVGRPGETVDLQIWLVFTESSKWKIDAFVKSIFKGPPPAGTRIDFDNPAWLQGRSGTCEVEIVEKQKRNGQPGEMVKFNDVKRFTYPSTELQGRSISTPPQRPAPAPAAGYVDDDDIPF